MRPADLGGLGAIQAHGVPLSIRHERRRLQLQTLVGQEIEAPGGAGFTSCEPDYGRDEEEQRRYVETPWEEFRDRD